MSTLWLVSWLVLLAPAEAQAQAGTHRIDRGDTLWTIARAHGCDVATLRAANPGLGEVLRVGTVLQLPACERTPTTTRTPTPTPTPTRTRTRTPTPPPTPTPTVRRHLVLPGETLAQLSRRYRIPVPELVRRNKLRSTTILVGRELDVGVRPSLVRTARRSESVLPSVADRDLARPAVPAGSGGDDDTDLRRLPSPADASAHEPDAFEETDEREPSDADVPEEESAIAEGPSTDEGPPSAHGKRKLARGQSIGKPNRGKLVGGVQLPKGPGYYRRHPTRSFGASHVVELTRAAIAEVRRKHPRVHTLAIGDISGPDGGRLSGHRSHQSGRDVDIGLYFVRSPKNYPKRFVGADEAPLHVAATWTLVEAFWRQSKTAGGPIAIFLDYGVQKRLYEYARKHGVDKRTLREVFQYPAGRRSRTGLLRHEPAHHDHLHVRFACHPRDRACG